MSTLLQYLRYAVRSLGKAPRFTALVVGTLALGIGANVALFTVVNSVLLRPLPYPDSERIVVVDHHAPGLNLPELDSSPGLIELYRASARTVGSIAATRGVARNLVSGDEPARVLAAEVTPELFDVLATPPAFGRPFIESDSQEGAPPVAILTYAIWQSRFGGDPGVIGDRIELDGRSTEIIGVMPRGFAYPVPEAALLLPFRLDAAGGLGTFGLRATARLAPGVDLEVARRELSALQSRIPERFADEVPGDLIERAGWSVSIEPLRDRMVGEVSRTLWVLFGTMGLALLIAGANVANLFLARAEARRREWAVRAALGASGGRIARSVLAESLLLGLLAGVVGVLIASAGVAALVSHAPLELPRLHEIRVDGAVLAFAAALSVLSGLALGVLPVPHLARQSTAAALQGGGSGTPGRERHRARSMLIVAQMALALVLLVGAGLMLRSVLQLHAVDPGFRAEGVLTAGVSLGETPGRARAVAFYHQLLDEVAALPGVASAGATASLPLGLGSLGGGSVEIESRPAAEDALPPVAMWHPVTDGYFETLGIQLREGRLPLRTDAEADRSFVWVNETFARRYLEDRVIGERLGIPNAGWAEVVGVVGDVRAFGLGEEVRPTVFLPMSSAATGTDLHMMHLVVRTDGPPVALAPALRAAVDRVDPTIPLLTVQTMEDILAGSLARWWFTLVLLSTASGLALVLGAVGLYGVINYVVSLRTTEIGIRLALGARPAAVRAMVMRQGLRLALVGICLGLVAAAAVARVLGSLVYGVSVHDPATFLAVAVILTLVALLASYLPARRATQVDPMIALRAE